MRPSTNREHYTSKGRSGIVYFKNSLLLHFVNVCIDFVLLSGIFKNIKKQNPYHIIILIWNKIKNQVEKLINNGSWLLKTEKHKFMNVRLPKSLLFIVLATIAFGWGIWLRVDGINSKALEYDEIWTLESYAKSPEKNIFTDLAMPNNHPLNSLLIKYSLKLTGDRLAIGIRLNAFIAGILTMIVVGIGAYLITKTIAASFFAILFVAFNGGLAFYAQTGRGYSVQSFLITTFVVGLIFFKQQSSCSGAIFKYFLSALLTLIAILAILTVPTSVLFLFPICLLYLLHNINISFCGNLKKIVITDVFRKIMSDQYIVNSFLLIGIFAIYWYLTNFSQFRQGQNFGIAVGGISTFTSFVIKTLEAIIDWKLLLLILAGLIAKSLRSWILMLLCITSFVLASAIIFKAGPERAYLPLAPLLDIVAACVVAELANVLLRKQKKIFGTGFCLMSGLIPIVSFSHNFDFWEPPDSKIIFAKVKNFPNNYNLLYPLNESYPLWFNNKPDIIKNAYIRLMHMTRDSFFVSIGKTAAFQGKRADASQCWIPPKLVHRVINLEYKNLCGYVYRLKKPVQGMELSKKIMVARIPIQERNTANTIREFLWKDPHNEWLLLNEWLNCPFVQNGKQFIAYVMISEKNSYSPSDLNAIETQSGGKVQFFYLDEVND